MSGFLSALLPRRSGIPVLMYHKIEAVSRDSLTVSTADFARQLAWLKSEGFETVPLRDFLDFAAGRKRRSELPPKPVLLTFDDGYASTWLTAAPLLARLSYRAVLFVTSGYVSGETPGPDARFLNADELRVFQGVGNDVALHSHTHLSYRDHDVDAIVSDLRKNQEWLRAAGIATVPVLAYPFGARPRDSRLRAELKARLAEQGVVAAFRIGNRIPTWSELEARRLDLYEIPRIDIRGDDTIDTFATKLEKGRLRPFQ